MRNKLANRRGAVTHAFKHDGMNYVGTFSTFDDGRPAEIFMNSEKLDTTADTNARDAAIAASLALQFGCPVETLRHALTRKPDGSALGPLGWFLDLIGEQR